MFCHNLYNNQINARALIGRSATVYCVGKLIEKHSVIHGLGFFIFYATQHIIKDECPRNESVKCLLCTHAVHGR